ncbi:MAG: hypothetical protein KAS30_01945, partial [Candidatus Diapherotrites archaeon]|nr:hypothetical protein [Candidatus Diapherotrites archaeon]
MFAIFALYFLTGVFAAEYVDPIDTSEVVEVDEEVILQTTINDLIYASSCELYIKKGSTLIDTVNATNSGSVISAKYTFESADTYDVHFKCLDKDMNPKSGSESELVVRNELKEPDVEELDIELPVELDVYTTFQTTAKDDSGIGDCTFIVEDDSENLIDEENASVSTPCTTCNVSESYKFDEIGSYFVYFSCTDNEGNKGIAEKELIDVREDVEKPLVSKIETPELITVGEKQRFEVEVSDNDEVDRCWFVVENDNEDEILKKEVDVGFSCDDCTVKTDHVFNVKDDFYVYFVCKDDELNEREGEKTKISEDIIEFAQVLSLVNRHCSSIDSNYLTTCTVQVKDFSDGVSCTLYDRSKPKENFDSMERDCTDSVDGCDCGDEECSCSDTAEGCVYEFKEVFKFFSVQYPSVGISCVNNENDELDRLVQAFSISTEGAPTYFNFEINGKLREYTNSRNVNLLVSTRGATECVFRNEEDDYGSWVDYGQL